MKASRVVTVVAAAALIAGSMPVVGQGRSAQGSPVSTAADAPRDPSTGIPTGKRRY